jgi:hypothetical protein
MRQKQTFAGSHQRLHSGGHAPRANAAGAKRYVVGWALDRHDRELLLATITPSYRDVIADHVTLAAGVAADHPLPKAVHAEIVGHVDDGAGVQALVVRIDGTTARPDGSVYHITWSLDPERGRKAAESNDVIRARGWEPLISPIPIRLKPTRFSS